MSTDKGPLQKKDHYMIYMQGRKGILQTRAPASKVPYIIYMQRAPCKEPLKTRAHATGGPFRNDPYKQSDSTHKRSLQTRSLYRQMASTANDPYRRCVIPTDKGLSQTIFRKGHVQTRAHTNKGPLQTLCNFYKHGAPT